VILSVVKNLGKMKKLVSVIFIALNILIMTNTSKSQSLNRDQIDTKDKWRLEDIYATDQAWSTAKKEVATRMEKISSFNGKLTSSAKTLLEFMDMTSNIMKDVS